MVCEYPRRRSRAQIELRDSAAPKVNVKVGVCADADENVSVCGALAVTVPPTGLLGNAEIDTVPV